MIGMIMMGEVRLTFFTAIVSTPREGRRMAGQSEMSPVFAEGQGCSATEG